jgi:hypothetical protein
MRIARFVCVAAIAGLAQNVAAQQQSQAVHLVEKPVGVVFVVKTVDLHHLTSAEAVKLLSPYSRSAGGGVYDVSPSMRAVTIRETPAAFEEMMAVLARYDRDPANVTLNFQLISADNGGTRDPAVAGLDSLLRGVLKFSGYRLLGTSVANASDRSRVSQSLSTDREPYSLTVEVSDLRVGGSDASVHLDVELWRTIGPLVPGRNAINPRILSTGVTVPMGQTVVLGTTAASDSVGQRALILTVRPQLVPTKK